MLSMESSVMDTCEIEELLREADGHKVAGNYWAFRSNNRMAVFNYRLAVGEYKEALG